MNDNIKQVIIVRTDLNMRKGKMVAQGAHASMKVFFDMMSTEKSELPVFQLDEEQKNSSGYVMKPVIKKTILLWENDIVQKWMEGSFAKIVVGCNSEKELLDLKKQADDAGIINALILDEGRTEFRKICSKCSGSGRYTSKDMMKAVVNCSLCNGTGKINKPTYTCLAIGPDTSEKIDKITGELKLL